MQKIQIMGIANLTEDSYFKDSRCPITRDDRAFLSRVGTMLEQGADIIDLGACSTRPGAELIDTQTEWSRLKPALLSIRREFPNAAISIDSFRSSIIQRACDIIGNLIINDISAGEDDPEMLPLAGALGLKYIAMHKRGTPQTMQSLTEYPAPITDAVLSYFQNFSGKAAMYGIMDWILDPGFGFAKTIEQNQELLRRLSSLTVIGRPILVGISRKSFIYKPLNLPPDSPEVLRATSAAHIEALQGGASILRVHDVGAAKAVVTNYLL